MNFSDACILWAAALFLGSVSALADARAETDDSSLRTWKNKDTGTMVEAHPAGLHRKTGNNVPWGVLMRQDLNELGKKTVLRRMPMMILAGQGGISSFLSLTGLAQLCTC